MDIKLRLQIRAMKHHKCYFAYMNEMKTKYHQSRQYHNLIEYISDNASYNNIIDDTLNWVKTKKGSDYWYGKYGEVNSTSYMYKIMKNSNSIM